MASIASVASTATTAADNPMITIRGISNYGNTCFLNSALQMLVQIRPLVYYFRTQFITANSSEAETALYEFFNEYIDGSDCRSSIGKLSNVLGYCGRQEDSMEAIRRIIALLDRKDSNIKLIIDSNLLGYYSSNDVGPTMIGYSSHVMVLSGKGKLAQMYAGCDQMFAFPNYLIVDINDETRDNEFPIKFKIVQRHGVRFTVTYRIKSVIVGGTRYGGHYYSAHMVRNGSGEGGVAGDSGRYTYVCTNDSQVTVMDKTQFRRELNRCRGMMYVKTNEETHN
jgi:hypothetical protein